MDLWKAKDSYINELRKVEPKVLFNKPPVRPYYYVRLTLNQIEYAIPLSSPKEKIRYNPFTQIIIEDNSNNELGRLFLINMIPFNTILFDKVNYMDDDSNYQSLLAKEERFLNKNISKITNKATTLYNARYNENHFKYTMLSLHCCDFKKLETVHNNLTNQITV